MIFCDIINDCSSSIIIISLSSMDSLALSPLVHIDMEIKHITFHDRDGVCSIGYRGDGVYEYACRVATSVIFVFFMKIFGQFFAKICTIFCFREKNKYIFFDNFHDFFFFFQMLPLEDGLI